MAATRPDSSPSFNPETYQGWYADNETDFHVVCAHASEDACWNLLLAYVRPGSGRCGGVQREVLRKGQTPARKRARPWK